MVFGIEMTCCFEQVGAHKRVPYSTHVEHYMSFGMFLLTLSIAEVTVVANLDLAEAADEEARFVFIEQCFYFGLGAIWVLGHLLLMTCGHTALFRSSWASLAKMEVDKIGPWGQVNTSHHLFREET